MPRIVTLAVAARWRTPTVLWQGVRAQRTVVRLPQADGELGVAAPDASGPLTRILVIGDSLAGGVGVPHHAQTLAGGLATRVADRRGGPVQWQVQARTGYTAGEIITLIEPDALRRADAVIVSAGANDAKNMHSARRWRTELTTLLGQVSAHTRDTTPIVLLPVPILQMCPALPPTLAHVLGSRTAQFDDIADQVASGHPRVRRFARFIPAADDLFAADGFHPAESFHAIYAEQIDRLLHNPEPGSLR